MNILVGLGNPGRRYARHRHNVGFLAIDRLAATGGISIDRRRTQATVGEGEVAGQHVLLVKPRTYMNASGTAVGPLVRRTGTPLGGLLVLYDDLDLPLGRIRLRAQGGAGGHNGMRSIIAALGSQEFPRLRIGIGRPEARGRSTIQHVLGGFSAEERQMLDDAMDRVVQAAELFLEKGIERAMDRYNA